MDKRNITLKRPATVDGVETKTLSMREPEVKDLRLAERTKGRDNQAEVEIMLFANLCEVPEEVIEGLLLADYKKLQVEYQSFFLM